MSISFMIFTQRRGVPTLTIHVSPCSAAPPPPGRLHTSRRPRLWRACRRPTAPIDLAERRIAFADGRPPAELGDDTAAVVESPGAALTPSCSPRPIYRGSLTGALKNLLDHVPLAALHGKPVALVAMGASDHHYLGAERHLRDLLAFFGAHTLPTAVYLTLPAISAEGRAVASAPSRARRGCSPRVQPGRGAPRPAAARADPARRAVLTLQRAGRAGRASAAPRCCLAER